MMLIVRPFACVLASMALWLMICGGMTSAAHSQERFLGLPPAPGEVGAVRRGRDGRIEPVQPIENGAERQLGGRPQPTLPAGRGGTRRAPAASEPVQSRPPEPATAPASSPQSETAEEPARAPPPVADDRPLPGWITDDRTGCRVWNADPRPGETVTWSGACVSNTATGQGVAQWFENGRPTDRYEGEYRDGLEHGTGAYLRANGERYDGEWRDGERSGRGVYVWPNGDRYDGEWEDGQRSGRGVYVWGSGQRYEGEWRAGQPAGEGRYSTPGRASANQTPTQQGGPRRTD